MSLEMLFWQRLPHWKQNAFVLENCTAWVTSIALFRVYCTLLWCLFVAVVRSPYLCDEFELERRDRACCRRWRSVLGKWDWTSCILVHSSWPHRSISLPQPWRLHGCSTSRFFIYIPFHILYSVGFINVMHRWKAVDFSVIVRSPCRWRDNAGAWVIVAILKEFGAVCSISHSFTLYLKGTHSVVADGTYCEKPLSWVFCPIN